MRLKTSLLYLSAILISTTLFISCDDGGAAAPEAPSINAPSSVEVLVGSSTELTFNVSTPEGYSSSSVTVESNGTAEIVAQPAQGSNGGEVVVSFTAQSTGVATITVNVTDQTGTTVDASIAASIQNEDTRIVVSSDITSDTTWEDGKVYVLDGRISVTAGNTLTIEPGTVIKGQAGEGANASTLIVAQDADIIANGTTQQPIIFTSVADEITPEMIDNGQFNSPNLSSDNRGLWGGVIILGNAPISIGSGTTAQIEGIPASDETGLYGGNDPQDSSGSFTYVSIRHGGTNIGQGNEINGLSLGGVGSGTTISHVEVVANADDGVEFFGGTVDATNLLVWNNGDDAIDTDQAWSGTVTNIVIVSPGGNALELDGPEGSFTSNGGLIEKGTVYVGAAGGDKANGLIDVDGDSDIDVTNIFFFGLEGAEGFSDGGYADYAANSNSYSISNLQAVIPDDLQNFFPSSVDVEEVPSVEAATVDADISEFDFSWAKSSGSLNQLGFVN